MDSNKTPNGDKMQGPPVDKAGEIAIDPTQNVLDLVKAAVLRLDDLREASERREDDLRDAAKCLSNTKHEHIKEVMSIRAIHAHDLSEAETRRLDAIRAIDVAAVGIATERAAASATVLANQVSSSAETLRALVANTATAASATAASAFSQLSDRISLLERTSYEGSGKSAVVDPIMTRLIEGVDTLRTNMDKTKGGTETRQEFRLNTGSLIGVGSFLIGLVLAVFSMWGG